LSWHQQHPRRSLDLIKRTALPKDARIIDVGGGDSSLVDDLISEGYRDITVLDLSRAALNRAGARVGNVASGRVAWLEGDILELKLPAEAAAFQLLGSERETHRTPAGLDQPFTYCWCRYEPIGIEAVGAGSR
jgi:ubiquinone/menaquinone biosynthesis C-methylase UbiE